MKDISEYIRPDVLIWLFVVIVVLVYQEYSFQDLRHKFNIYSSVEENNWKALAYILSKEGIMTYEENRPSWEIYKKSGPEVDNGK